MLVKGGHRRHIHPVQRDSLCRAIAFIQIQRRWQCSLDSQRNIAAVVVQWERSDTNFRENISNLWVLCIDGNNDRSARVLFAQHPQEQGDWLRSGFDCIIHLAPSGARRTPPQPVYICLPISVCLSLFPSPCLRNYLYKPHLCIYQYLGHASPLKISSIVYKY